MASLFLLHRTPTDPATITDRYAYLSLSFTQNLPRGSAAQERTHVATNLIDTYNDALRLTFNITILYEILFKKKKKKIKIQLYRT